MLSDTESIKQLPFSFAKRHGVVVTDTNDEKVTVACLQISPMVILETRRFLRQPVALEIVNEDEFETMLQQIYEEGASDAVRIADDIEEDMDLQSIANQLPEPTDLFESEDDAPIIRLINGLLTEAIKKNASDVHIEPFESHLRVRLRIDGVLHEVLRPSKVLAPFLVSRIKVMARLDIAEKRLPQDGRISLRVAGRPVDVRVSTIPSGHGERVVMRLLDKQASRLNLEHLGMDTDTLAKVDRIIHRPNGIILVTGPTGSGKTTTLYAALARLNEKSRNIMTVEDPIEYYINGIGQTQVSAKVDMTFARGLRAILRQDPDVVMIGEIRDLETAEIAVQASLTGHLVFSTLHTNTAVGAVTRLRDMGIEPFLISSTLSAVLAQRLVRLLCESCKTPHNSIAAECELLGITDHNITMGFEAVGCDACNSQGYKGRTGIYELMEVDEHVKTMIHEGCGEQELDTYVMDKCPSIRMDGLRRIQEGATTLAEVVLVTHEDSID